MKSWKSPNQSRAPGEKDGKDNIGHGGGDPDDLAARFDALYVFDVERVFLKTESIYDPQKGKGGCW